MEKRDRVIPCPSCMASGRITHYDYHKNGTVKICEHCDGRGSLIIDSYELSRYKPHFLKGTFDDNTG